MKGWDRVECEVSSLQYDTGEQPYLCTAAQCRGGMQPEEQGTVAKLQLRAVVGGQDSPQQGPPAKGTSQHEQVADEPSKTLYNG